MKSSTYIWVILLLILAVVGYFWYRQRMAASGGDQPSRQQSPSNGQGSNAATQTPTQIITSPTFHSLGPSGSLTIPLDVSGPNTIASAQPTHVLGTVSFNNNSIVGPVIHLVPPVLAGGLTLSQWYALFQGKQADLLTQIKKMTPARTFRENARFISGNPLVYGREYIIDSENYISIEADKNFTNILFASWICASYPKTVEQADIFTATPNGIQGILTYVPGTAPAPWLLSDTQKANIEHSAK
jgi:hypothetical protein